jgi:hypothetical protein
MLEILLLKSQSVSPIRVCFNWLLHLGFKFWQRQSKSCSYLKQGVKCVGLVVIHSLYSDKVFLLNKWTIHYIWQFSTSYCKHWLLCIPSDYYLKNLITLWIDHSNKLMPCRPQKSAKIQLFDTLCVHENLKFSNNQPGGYLKNSITGHHW